MRLIIIGAGGHGRVVADAARAAGRADCVFVDRTPPADLVDGLPVFDSLETAVARGTDACQFIVAIGDNGQRAGEYVHACELGLEPATIIHPSAVISPSAVIGPGAYIGAQAVINPGACMGENAIINTAAVVEHDCRIGAHAFIAPGAVLCGGAQVGDGSFIGAGAVLIPLISVGADVMVAAGAVVVDHHPDAVRLFGVPAKARPDRLSHSDRPIRPDCSARSVRSPQR